MEDQIKSSGRNSTKKEHCICGEKQEHGFFVCENCGQRVYLNDGDTLMQCPRCDCKNFEKE